MNRKVVDGRILVELAGFSVVRKDGRRYAANHLATVFAEAYRNPVLTFVCSGVAMTIPTDEIERIEFHEGGVQHCNECDQQFPTNLVPAPNEAVEVLR